MSNTDQMAPEPREFSVRVPRPLWIGMAAVVLVVAGAALRTGLPIVRQQTAIQEIERLGGTVVTRQGGPRWLRERLGDERLKPFDTVIEVILTNSNFTDAEMPHLAGLPQLEELVLDGTRITDAGLPGAGELRSLRLLYLDRTAVTDAGVAHLRRFSRMEVLSLFETRITDAALADLVALTRLQELYVGRTRLTDTGVADLQGALRTTKVWKLASHPDF